MRRPSVGIFILVLVAIAIPASRAQEIDNIYVTPTANAPFSGVVHVQRTIIRHDGSVTHLKGTREIGRDRRGRTYDERRPVVSESQTTDPPVIRIQLYDPEVRLLTVIFPADHTFVRRIVNDPPSPPPSLNAMIRASLAENSSSDYLKEENLGIRDISGVPAHGLRSLKITPANASGTGKEVLISDEYWYSDELRIYVLIRHDDPRTGTLTMTLEKITRNEPNPALFEIPAGYNPKN